MNQVKIKDIVADKKYAVVDGPFGTQLHASEYVEEGVPVIRVKNIGWGPFINKDLKFITEEKASEIDRSSVFPGDIIIAKTGATIGKTCVFPDIFEKAIIASSCAKISLDHTKAISDYVYRFLLSPHGYAQIIGQSAGSTRTTIGLKGINDLKIPIPPLDQQKKIAAILDAADAYRQKTKALIEKYDELTQSLFLDMFGDPVTNPKGWESSKLGLLIENKDAKRVPVKSSDRDDMIGDFPYYGASGVIDYVDDYTHEGDNLLIGEDGANLLTRNTPIAFIAKGQYWVNNHAHVLGYNGKALLVYLEFFINLINLSPYISGSAQPKLNRKNMDQIKVYCPPLELQTQFAERVQAIEAQKAQAENSLAGAEDLFNSLLQRAFKGELT